MLQQSAHGFGKLRQGRDEIAVLSDIFLQMV